MARDKDKDASRKKEKDAKRKERRGAARVAGADESDSDSDSSSNPSLFSPSDSDSDDSIYDDDEEATVQAADESALFSGNVGHQSVIFKVGAAKVAATPRARTAHTPPQLQQLMNDMAANRMADEMAAATTTPRREAKLTLESARELATCLTPDLPLSAMKALIEASQIKVSSRCGGDDRRTKRNVLADLRHELGVPPLPVPMGLPVRDDGDGGNKHGGGTHLTRCNMLFRRRSSRLTVNRSHKPLCQGNHCTRAQRGRPRLTTIRARTAGR